MAGHEIIVVGASAGGVETLMQLVREFPADLPASIFIVLHTGAQGPGMLPGILSRSGRMKALHPVDHQHIERGYIYVAPPDHHLLIERDFMRVVRGPKENRHRPAIDPLFRSAAVAYGPEVVGVVLSGMLDDGTAGLQAVKQRGGIAVVQDPQEAIYPDMPRSALTHVPVDHCLPVAQIGSLLVHLAGEKVEQKDVQPASEEMKREVRIAEMETNPLNDHEQVGKTSAYSCPDCGGVLWETQDSELTRFRCRVGHAFSTESILAQQSENIEQALWVALKTLEENVDLSHRMAQQAQRNGHTWLVEKMNERAREREQQAALLRRILMQK